MCFGKALGHVGRPTQYGNGVGSVMSRKCDADQHADADRQRRGRRYCSDGTLVAGQQFDYGFDDIANRDTTGGRASAVGSYTNDLLNRITGRGVAPYVLDPA